MHRKIISGYIVFCIFFFLALAGYLVVRVSTTWGANARDSRSDFDELARLSASRYLSAGDFASTAFRVPMKQAAEGRPRLLAAVVYSRSAGVQYAFLRDRELLPDPAAAPWQGSPRYGALPWGTRLYRMPYAPGHGGDLAVDGLYTVVGRQDAFPILKETFVLLFCFLVLTCLVLLLAPNLAADVGRPGDLDPEAPQAARSPASPPSREAAGATPDLFSPITGLAWQNHLEQRLKFELERAASFDQDLALAVMAIDELRQGGPGDQYGEVAAAIRRAFPYQDLTFEHGAGRFALILPDQDIDRGIENVGRFLANTPKGVTLCTGLSSRNGRLVSGKTLLAEAERALDKARADGRGRVVAFRADPAKYRDTVSRAR